jgi:hypothetical protein
VKTDPKVRELLGPFAEQGIDPASRRFQVDREKIVSRMVEVSLTPDARFGARARVAAALALAASFALASWGGLRMWQQRSGAGAGAVEVVALRGAVKSIQGPIVSDLGVGKPTRLLPQGTLETARGAEARIKTGSGIEIELLEGTLVAMSELSDNSALALRLARGRVRCVVSHQPGRTFSVVTAAARVVDVGTTFSVGVEETATGPQTFVQVEEGEVLVQHAGQESRLGRAQTWTSAAAKPVEQPDAASSIGELEREPSVAKARHEQPKRRPETLAAETKLLRSGLASEQKGDLKGAATAFETLTSRYPESQLAPDAKAALARVKGRLESSK